MPLSSADRRMRMTWARLLLLCEAALPWAGAVLAAVVLTMLPACTTDEDPAQKLIDSAAVRTSAPASEPALATRPAVPFRPPTPRSAGERVEDRNRMVDTQIANPRDDREPVRDPKVLQAMRTVPRHVFVPENYRQRAYADTPLPIGHGQTISQPYIVALMTEALKLTPEMKVLEIGTGSGYQAAVLAQLTPHVYTIEIIKPLGEIAQEVLRRQGYDTIHCRIGDGYKGWPEAAPFDAIIVTCAAEHIPEPLWDQLKPGGRIVIPTGTAYGPQELLVVTKTPDGKRRTQTITGVRFVPLIRQ